TQMVALPWLLKRFDEATLVVWGTIARGVGALIYAVITTPWLGPVASVFFALGIGIMMPSLQSLATRTVPDQVRGGVLGWYQSALSLSTIISTAIAGVLFALSPTVPYWTGAGLSFLAVLPALVLLNQARNQALKAGLGEVTAD
ncbi:MAG: MFS transporter, partial [Spongiibacter sp.]|nr:MFS transporter [Spongiibacter sp.]